MSNVPSQEARTESLPSESQRQLRGSRLGSGISKIHQKVQIEETTNAEEDKPSQPLVVFSANDSQSKSLVEINDARGRRSSDLASTERRKQGSKHTSMEQEKLLGEGMAGHDSNQRLSSDGRAVPSQRAEVAWPRAHMMPHTVSAEMARTERQLLHSHSNYEILQSGNQSTHNISFSPSLLASINSKRVQHQREEQMRRDRMRRALETLADVLPHKAGAQRAASGGVTKSSNKAEVVENAIEYIRELHKVHGIKANAGDGAVGLDNQKDG